MKRSRRKDWQTGWLFKPCEGCENMECLTTGVPCSAVEAILETATHTESQAWPELWGDMADCERHNAYTDGTSRSRIVEVL